MISLQREVEVAKTNLAQCEDFNMVDAFNMLDLDSKGYFTAP
jgi:hypothetical protein